MSETAALTEKRERVERFITGILERTGLPADLEIEEREGKGLSLAILPREPGSPLGRGLGGALQVLASRVMNRPGEPRAWVTVGVGGHLPPKAEREPSAARSGDRSAAVPGAKVEREGDASGTAQRAGGAGAAPDGGPSGDAARSTESAARSERGGRGESPAGRHEGGAPPTASASEEARERRVRSGAGARPDDPVSSPSEVEINDEVLAARVQALAERVERWGRPATVMALSEEDRRQALAALEGSAVTGFSEGGGALRRLRLKPSWVYRPPRAPEDE